MTVSLSLLTSAWLMYEVHEIISPPSENKGEIKSNPAWGYESTQTVL